MADKLFYPATQRNREPLLEAVRDVLRSCKRVLEVASGSGEHVEFLAPAFPDCLFQPTDIEQACLASIRARSRECRTQNIAEPRRLDVTSQDWPASGFDAVLSVNMIHIAPWSACEGLMRGAGSCLVPEGHLCLYGPFMRSGRHTAPSNEAFSADLTRRDPTWAVRDLDDVTREAERNGLDLIRIVEMPANNLTVLYRRSVRQSATDPS